MHRTESLAKRDIQDITALTPVQEGMLFHHQMEPRSGHYFEQLSLELNGTIDLKSFNESWNWVVRSNDVLRTVFRWKKLEKPVQMIVKNHCLIPRYHDFSTVDVPVRSQRLTGVKEADRNDSFDLTDVAFRVILCKIEPQRYEMVVSYHHILMDGWSTGIVLNEFFQGYELLKAGEPLPVRAKTPYKAFVRWVQLKNSGKHFQQQREFWGLYLKGVDTGTLQELSIKHRGANVRPERSGHESHSFPLDSELTGQLDGLSKESKVTLAAILYSAWGLLVMMYTNSRDVVFGTTMSGRSARIEGIEEMVGLFIGTLPFRLTAGTAESILSLLQRTEREMLERDAFGHSALADIKRFCGLDVRQELFDTLVVLENYPLDRTLTTDSMLLTPGPFHMKESAHYDLTVSISVFDGIRVNLTFDTTRLDPGDIRRIGVYYNRILSCMTAFPGRGLEEIEILTEDEKQQILEQFNDSQQQYPRDKTIPQLFREQAEKFGERCSVISAQSHFTYRELDRRAGRLAVFLHEKGVGPGSIVALLAEQSLETVTALLGIVYAGAAYLPVSPDYPPERIRYMVKDSSAKLLLTANNLTPGIPNGSGLDLINGLEIVSLAMANGSLEVGVGSPAGAMNCAPTITAQPNSGSSTQLSYIIYTSGTSGKPKGVMVEHGNVIRLVKNTNYVPLNEGERIMQTGALEFDASTFEIWGALLNGLSLILVPKKTVVSVRHLKEAVRRFDITTIWMTVSLFNQISTADIEVFEGLRNLLVGGDVLSPFHINRLHRCYPELNIINGYGPTENTTFSTFHPIRREYSGAIPIGRPVANSTVYILDTFGRPQPLNLAGELWVGGCGVSRGYLNNPELTAEKFIHLTFYPSQPIRLYRTGDLARWLPDGVIEFLGRSDQQVKIRGFRIEAGEIENCLLMHPDINEVAVLSGSARDGDKYLCAYYSSVESPEADALRVYVGKTLPEYMIPAYFIRLDALPLTANGKIDRRALPEPDLGKLQGDYRAPRNGTEETLAALWRVTLGRTEGNIGIDDDFFSLGGHSLKAARLVSLIHKHLGIEFSPASIFETPTIREMADRIVRQAGTGKLDVDAVECAENKEYYPLSPTQQSFFAMHQTHENTTLLNMPLILSLKRGDILLPGKLDDVLAHLVSRHDSLRTSFHIIDEKPVQRIHENIDFSIREIGPGGSSETIENNIAAFVQPFDLTQAPLFRAMSISVDGGDDLLILDMHHLVADGTSQEIMVRELATLCLDDPGKLLKSKFQYKDFLHWQNRQRDSDDMQEHERYWLDRLAGPLPVLSMPADFPRSRQKKYRGESFNVEMDPALCRDIRSLCRKYGTTLYMVFLTAFNILLSKYSGHTDIIVGSPSANRENFAWQHTVGLFMNSLLMRNFPGRGKTFSHFLMEIKTSTREAYRHQSYPLETLLKRLDIKPPPGRNPVTDVALNLLNMYDSDLLEQWKSKLYMHKTAKVDLTLTILDTVGGLEFIVEYDVSLFRRERMERLAGHFLQILVEVVNEPNIPLWKINMITAEEMAKVLEFVNGPDIAYPRDKTLHHLIRERAEAYRNRRSISRGHVQVSYRELGIRANRMAHRLQEKGVGPGAIVAIMMERSVEMIVAILGILEAGGAYLPIDSSYPKDRIDYMLKDSNTTVLLTADDITESCPVPRTAQPPARKTNSSDPAYVIYTSGTTGKPKGVAVRHRNIVAYLWSFLQEFSFRPDDIVLQQASIAFDTFGEEVYPALLKGGTVAVPSAETVLDADLLAAYLRRHQVTVVDCSPLLLNELNKRRLPHSLRLCISGGDVLQGEYIGELLAEGRKVYNTYGPTETTICATFFKCGSHVPSIVPIGKPIGNSKVMILDPGLRPLPVGPAGELCIGGAGIAAGYLNRPELTIERFINLAFNNQRLRVYKTGDLGRWITDGNIEFIGRIDSQVNVRGYRIELEEIRCNLVTHNAVADAVITAKERSLDPGDRYLCAYIVTDETGSGPLPVKALRNHLERVLPGYMVPAYFVAIPSIPLTQNGKLDESALPDPGPQEMEASVYLAPRDANEAIIADIWAGVLGREQDVGIDDNFFELGGDSIIAIQVASRLKKHGLEIKVSDIFQHQTIRRLSTASGVRKPVDPRPISQAIVTGEAPLTPIQSWFFAQHFSQQHHFNLAMVLFRPEGFDEDLVRQVWQKLTLHHDALRMVFGKKAGRIIQVNRGDKGNEHVSVYIESIDLTGIDENETAAEINAEATRIQSGMDLKNGPLVRVGLFKTRAGHHLLIAIHHLVVDGVSWRILLDDFSSGYRQVEKGEPLHLPGKTASYLDWAQELNRPEVTECLQTEENYWRRISDTSTEPLPRDWTAAPGEMIQANVRNVEITLDESATRQLLTEVNRAYNTGVEDILLTALGLAVFDWTGNRVQAITLEGHGRDYLTGNIDITRTVGWFTTRFPVVLELEPGEGHFLNRSIKKVKETLRAIPGGGAGYGILRYLAGINGGMEPEIGFNYLGQFEQSSGGGGVTKTLFTVSHSNTGYSYNPEMEWRSGIEVNGIVTGSSLTMVFSFNYREFDENRIRQLSEGYLLRLKEIIRHCLNKQIVERTPSDMDLKGLSLTDLEHMQRHVRRYYPQSSILNVYTLSPLQSGILFHYRMNSGSNAYYERNISILRGLVDPGLLKRSLEHLVARHDIFRTLYFYKDRDIPVQAVLDRVNANFRYTDRPEEPDGEEPVDLETQVPLKLTLIRTGQEMYRLQLSYHHIQVDGWAMAIVFKELLQVYRQLKNRMPVNLEPATPYVRYIRWLESRDRNSALDYWREYLADYEEPAGIPASDRKTPDDEEDYRLEEYCLTIDNEISQTLDRVMVQHHLTVNTVFQTAWGILLQRYNYSDDVIFGSVVSGRSSEIEGIENMVGLFINTLPVRFRVSSIAPGSVLQLMEHLAAQALISIEHGFLPLTDIQSLTALNRRLIRHIIVIENYPVQQELQSLDSRFESDCGFRIESIEGREQTNYDLNIVVLPGETLRVTFNYNGNRLTKDGVIRISEHLAHILRQILANPAIPLNHIELVTVEEKDTVLSQFNRKDQTFTSGKTMVQMVDEQVEKSRNRCSVIGDRSQITYGEMRKRANRLAYRLRHRGVTPGDIVAIKAEPAVEVIIGIIGILKAGAAYLPVDPGFPGERIDFMLKDSNAKMLLTTADLAAASRAAHGTQAAAGGIGTANTAYVIYTSGTSGKPKGVPVMHRNVSPLLHWGKRFGIGPGDRTMRNLAFIFDWSVWEVFITLTEGAALCIAPDEVRLNPEKNLRYMNAKEITVLHATPSQFHYIANAGIKPGKLRYLFLGAEMLTWELVEKSIAAVPGSCRVFNMYGPTECTIIASTFEILRKGHEPYRALPAVPIGSPGINLSFYLLDKYRQPCPVGIPGELFIAGDGVTAGYLNQPELTSERFVHVTLDSQHVTLYRTGDFTRWLPEGCVEFLGRIDQQVKIRGYRIELAEVENHIQGLEGVDSAAVKNLENENGEAYLVAYVVSSNGVDTSVLRGCLAKTLPDYMIPSGFMKLDKLPLSPSGKIDRKALPEPLESDTRSLIPQTPEQKQLAAIWSLILDIPVDRIGIDSDFFNLGGHSLKAAVLVEEIHRQMNIKVRLKDVFSYPTIQSLAAAIEKNPGKNFERIQPAEQRDYYPLSPAQKRLFILDGMNTESVNYNIFTALRLTGRVDKCILEDVFRRLIMRHESLRTSFLVIDETPVQQIHDTVDFSIEETEPLGPANDGVNRFIRPFDLAQAPLIRVGLIRQKDDRHIMILDMHHIISDGMSMRVIIQDFTAIYGGKEIGMHPLNINYRDYAAWIRQGDFRQKMRQQQQYWMRRLSGEIPVLHLPYDYPRPLVQSFEGKLEVFQIGERQTGLLNRLARHQQTTMFVVLMTAYTVLLSKLSGSEDVPVGTPVMGRRHAQLLDIVGMFVNMLVIRCAPEPGKPFHRFLGEMHELSIEAFENQEYPFEELVRDTRVLHDASRNPLFDVSLVMQNTDAQLQESQLSGLKITPYPVDSKTSKFDVSFNCAEENGQLIIAVEYAARLFKAETILRFIRYFKTIVDLVTANIESGYGDCEIGGIDILAEDERRTVLIEFNRTHAGFPRGKTIQQLFEEQAERSAGRISVIRDLSQITYGELNRRANGIASLLQEKGIGPGEIVALEVDRSVETIIGLLGILKAGAAYLPIDPAYPKNRIDYILKDSSAKVILTAGDISASLLATRNPQPVTCSVGPAAVAYIIYTSGTTGRPKGVMIEHRSVINLAVGQCAIFGVKQEDRILQFSSLTFDASVEQVFIAFFSGAALVLADKERLMDPQRFALYIACWTVTHIHAVPSFLKLLPPGYYPGLKRVIAGGDVCPPSLARTWANNYDFYNEYGPTETTVTSTELMVDPETALKSRIPIGRPLSNTQIYILDNVQQPVPVGVTGDMYISGVGVARGYLNNPELTAERFVHVTINTQPLTLYKTGDLARWLPRGNIEFLGRKDHQVKVRGFRIELGEIERCLKEAQDIDDAVVILTPGEDGDPHLCAYVVAGQRLEHAGLRRHLSQILPDHMIPSYFVQLDEMPLTPNGKIHREALPKPVSFISGSRSTAPPRTSLEKALANIWMDVLSCAPVGIDDNFFSLGGHSLKATSLVSRMNRILGVKITLSDVFRLPTIRALSESIISANHITTGVVEAVEQREYYPLSSAQKRLYILQQMEPGNIHYNIPIAVVLEGKLIATRLEDAFRQLIHRHESLRTSFIKVDENPVQKVHKTVEFQIEYFHSTGSESEESIQSSKQVIRNSFVRAFHLSEAPLMRVGIIRMGEALHTLVVDTHHIVSDGTSSGILVTDFMAFYSNRETERPDLSIHYKDFTSWQERYFRENNGVMDRQARFWNEEFCGGLPELKLPTDFPRPEIQGYEGSQLRFTISTEITGELMQMASARESTLFMLLLAVFNILLAKLSGQEDIVVGSPIANRRHPDLETIVGMFVNTLVLRNFPRNHLRFCDFLDQLRHRTLEAYENQEYPFEKLVANLGLQRQSSRNSLFDVMFVFQNLDVPEIEMDGLKLKPLDYTTGISQFDLIFLGYPTKENLEFIVIFSTALYKEETVQRFIDYFNDVLQAVLASDEIAIGDIKITYGLEDAHSQLTLEAAEDFVF